MYNFLRAATFRAEPFSPLSIHEQLWRSWLSSAKSTSLGAAQSHVLLVLPVSAIAQRLEVCAVFVLVAARCSRDAASSAHLAGLKF